MSADRHHPTRRAILAGCAATPLLAGCQQAFLPNSGPRRADVANGAEIRVRDVGPQGRVAYALIAVQPPVVARLRAEEKQLVFNRFVGVTRTPEIRIGVGDVLSLTVFEAASGGLFVPLDAGSRPGNFVQMPNQTVDQSGNITVPFGGQVQAAGQTPRGLQRLIEGRLKQRALEPQVLVTINDSRANVITVSGDVGQSTRYALDPGGDKLLSALARAGGARFPTYESTVTIQRAGTTDKALLSEVAMDPTQNLTLLPGDTVIVQHEPRYYIAVGATGQSTSIGPVNRRFSFDDARLTLVDAIAKAGWLLDDRANPQAVFLFRFEPRTTIDGILGPDSARQLPEEVPTIYQLDLLDPGGFFSASRMPMRQQDMIYVSNSPATDISKFESLVVPLASSATGFRSGFGY